MTALPQDGSELTAHKKAPADCLTTKGINGFYMRGNSCSPTETLPFPQATVIIIQIKLRLVNLFYPQNRLFLKKFYAMPYSGEIFSLLFGHIHECKLLKTIVETAQFSTIDFVQSHRGDCSF